MFIIEKHKKSILFFVIFVLMIGLYVALAPLKIKPSKAVDVWVDLGGTAGISDGNGSPLSLDIGSNDIPYVAFTDTANSSAVGVKKYVSDAWMDLTIPTVTMNSGARISLKVGNVDNLPYVAYQDGTSSKVTLKKYNGSTWDDYGPANFSSSSASYINLLLNSSDVPMVIYGDSSNAGKATAKMLYLNSWIDVGTPDFSTGTANYLTAAISPDGSAYVAYTDGGNSNKLTVMKLVDNDWALVGTPGFSTGTVDDFMSLGFSSDNTPYIAYDDNYNSEYKVTVKKFYGGSWVDVGNTYFSHANADEPKIAFDSQDIPYVAYSAYVGAGTDYKTSVVKLVDNVWTIVGSEGFSIGSSTDNSFDINSLDQLFFAYVDSNNSNKLNVSAYLEVAPTISVPTVTTSTDGSGYVNILSQVDDGNDDSLSISYRYSSGSCATYDGTQATSTISSVSSSTYGTPTLDNSDSNGYQVQSVITSSGANTVTTTWDSKTDLPNVDGDTYCVYVFSYDGTVSSTVATTTITLDNVAPDAPTISSSSSETDSITYSWAAVSGAISYYVQLNSETAISTTDTSYTFSSLNSGTSYTVGVKAVDSYGNASSYATASVQTVGVSGSLPAPSSSGSGSNSTSADIGESKDAGPVTTDGTNLLVYIGSEINFDFGSESTAHKATVKDLDTTTGKVTLELQSSPIVITLLPKQTKDVDLDGDGQNDVRIKYNDLLVNRIDLTVTKLETKETTTVDTNQAPEKTCNLIPGNAYKTSEKVTVYYITENCTKRSFPDEETYFSYFDTWKDFDLIDKKTLDEISFDDKGPMSVGTKYNALVRLENDSKVYVLSEGNKYWIPSSEVFTKLNYGWNWISIVPEDFLNNFIDAGAITDVSKRPNYTIVKYPNSPLIYRIEPDPKDASKQIKRPIPTEKDFRRLHLRFDRVIVIPSSEQYPSGSEIKP